VQVSFVYREMLKSNSHHLLLELYYDEPVHLYLELQDAMNICDNNLDDFELYSRPVHHWKSDPRYKEVKQLLVDLQHDLNSALDLPQFRHVRFTTDQEGYGGQV